MIKIAQKMRRVNMTCAFFEHERVKTAKKS